jgi:hypothetical protein
VICQRELRRAVAFLRCYAEQRKACIAFLRLHRLPASGKRNDADRNAQ